MWLRYLPSSTLAPLALLCPGVVWPILIMIGVIHLVPLRHAKRPRVHIFLATSEIHMTYKLRMTKEQVVETAVNAVKHLVSIGCKDIEFSPEDAGRSEPAFLFQVGPANLPAGILSIILTRKHAQYTPTTYMAD